MRILQVVDSLNPVYGGPPTVVLRLSAALALEGADVTLYSNERPGSAADIARACTGIPGIERVHRISDDCSSRLAQLRGKSTRDFLRRWEHQFDIVHVHGLWRPTLWWAVKESLRRGIPYVLTPHGMFARWALRQKPLRKRAALALSWRSLTRRALFVHMLTQSEANDLRDLDIDTPVEVVPNGFFVEELDELPARGSFFASRPELDGHRFILFLGRLHYVKRVDLLVRAFAKVAKVTADVRLVLAGPDCGARLEIEALVKTLGLAPRVHLVGSLYGPQKYAALVDALCFCQASVYETFSMSILEAMACGVPPVITRGCNFDEVGTAGAGIVVDGSEDAIADAILSYCTDREAREQAAKKSQELVVTKYTWPIIGKKMLATYEARLRGLRT